MSAPLRSASLGEFWGKRRNLGFRQLAHQLIFRPLHRTLGAGAAGFLVFGVSGLIHDLVISLPARGGYGLPTIYFLLQGTGTTIEHSRFGKRLGLGQGLRGWAFIMAFLAAPVFLLFHQWFVMRVILPLQLPSTIPTGVETGLAAIDNVQPETALGTERIHSADDHCFWQLDLGAAHRTAARRPSGLGACLLYRDLLDYEDSCGRALLFARGLAPGDGICRRTRPTDPSVFSACR
jgi:hypothetical protein